MEKSILNKLKARRTKGVSTLGAVLAVIIAVIAIIVGVYVTAQLQLTLNTSGIVASAQNAIGNVFSTAYNAFQLLTVALIILAAVAILAIVIRGLGGGGGGEL